MYGPVTINPAMPDKRKHRGANPQDAKLFAKRQIPTLSQAVHDYSLLLSMGYAQKCSLKLVGDRFALTERQRIAVMRCSCSDEQLEKRRAKHIEPVDLKGKDVAVDGYNLLITVESAVSGGLIFKGRDGAYRDLAGIHGTYRKVQETIPSIELIAESLNNITATSVTWLFDSPVSNSGRLKAIIFELIEKNSWQWDVKLLQNPDSELARTDKVVISSDSNVLDKCRSWSNLAGYILKQQIRQARIFDLSDFDDFVQ